MNASILSDSSHLARKIDALAVVRMILDSSKFIKLYEVEVEESIAQTNEISIEVGFELKQLKYYRRRARKTERHIKDSIFAQSVIKRG